MNQRTKSLFIGGTLLVGSFGPAVALAQTPARPAGTQAQGQLQEQSITGSIRLPQTAGAAYGSMATVTLNQAVKAAQDSLGVTDAPTATPGTATSAQLENENGFLVWEVVIGNQTLMVDAGNARVLQTEQVGADEESGGNESGYNEEGSNARGYNEEGGNGSYGHGENGPGNEEQQNEGGAEDNN